MNEMNGTSGTGAGDGLDVFAHPSMGRFGVTADDLLAVVEGGLPADRREAVRALLEAEPGLARALQAMKRDRAGLVELGRADAAASGGQTGAAAGAIASAMERAAAAGASDGFDPAAVEAAALDAAGLGEIPASRLSEAKPAGPMSIEAWRRRLDAVGGVTGWPARLGAAAVLLLAGGLGLNLAVSFASERRTGGEEVVLDSIVTSPRGASSARGVGDLMFDERIFVEPRRRSMADSTSEGVPGASRGFVLVEAGQERPAEADELVPMAEAGRLAVVLPESLSHEATSVLADIVAAGANGMPIGRLSAWSGAVPPSVLVADGPPASPGDVGSAVEQIDRGVRPSFVLEVPVSELATAASKADDAAALAGALRVLESAIASGNESEEGLGAGTIDRWGETLVTDAAGRVVLRRVGSSLPDITDGGDDEGIASERGWSQPGDVFWWKRGPEGFAATRMVRVPVYVGGVDEELVPLEAAGE